MRKIKILFHATKFDLKLAIRAGRTWMYIYILLQVIQISIPLLCTFFLSLLLDEVMYNKEMMFLLIYLVVFACLTLGGRIVEKVLGYVYSLLNEKMSHEYDVLLAHKLNDLPLSFIDSSNGKDLIEDVIYIKNTVTSFFREVINVFVIIYSFIIAFGVLIRYNILFSLLFVMLTIPGIIVNQIFELEEEKVRRRKAPDVRKFSYYRWMLVDSWPAKDVRMYNLTEPLRERYNQEKNEYLKLNKKLDKSKLKISVLLEIVKRSGEIFFIYFVIVQAINGMITIGNVALYIGLALSVSESFQIFTKSIVEMVTETADKMRRFFEFYDIPCIEKNEAFRSVESFQSLEFDNVYFKYPYQEEYVLKGVSFMLKKGERLSIVGVNGAGKTTIIKLILGLYEVESGVILLNGYPLADYNIADVHRLFSVLFQQFAQYPLTLRENIALSEIYCAGDNERVKEAMKQSAIYEQMKDYIDKSMTRQYDDWGIELSRGQWQKVALARTYFKNAQVVIFDEPSAALDAEAEDYIFVNYCRLSKHKTGIMISHRIYGAKYSTRIIVLSDGKIVEDGTHDELVKNNGLYAQFYILQKSKYVVKGGGD